MQLLIDSSGILRCLYDEAIDLAALGQLKIERASQVEPDSTGNWHADLAASGGPVLGPFAQRSQALAAERDWLEANMTSSS